MGKESSFKNTQMGKKRWDMFPENFLVKESQTCYPGFAINEHQSQKEVEKTITLRPFNRVMIFQSHQTGTAGWWLNQPI